MNHLFYKENVKTGSGKWKVNLIGRARTYLNLEFYKKVEKRFIEEGEFAFMYHQLE